MFFSTLTGFTQDIEFSFSAKTGNAEFDLTLENLNIEAKADLDSFKAEMSISYEIPEPKIDYIFEIVKMEPADVYMTLALSVLSSTPVDEVVLIYKNKRQKG